MLKIPSKGYVSLRNVGFFDNWEIAGGINSIYTCDFIRPSIGFL